MRTNIRYNRSQSSSAKLETCFRKSSKLSTKYVKSTATDSSLAKVEMIVMKKNMTEDVRCRNCFRDSSDHSRQSAKKKKKKKKNVFVWKSVNTYSTNSEEEGGGGEEGESFMRRRRRRTNNEKEYLSTSYKHEKSIALALFKHKTEAVVTLGMVLLFSTADRTIFTLTALPIARELGLSIKDIGLIQNVFLLGYMMTNVIGGHLSTPSRGKRSISPANLLFIALFFWSLAVLLLPVLLWLSKCGLVGFFSPFSILLISRLLFGLASGVALPAAAGFAGTSSYFLNAERGETFTTLLSMFNCGSGFGFIFGGFLVPIIGWKGAFFVFGSCGMVYAVIAFIRLRRLDKFIEKVYNNNRDFNESNNNSLGGLNEEESTTIKIATEDEAYSKDVNINQINNKNWFLLSSVSMKLQLGVVLFSHIMTNVGFFTFQNWLGIYMQGALGFSVSDTGAFLFLPWFMTALVAFYGGKLCQKAIVERSVPAWKTRQIAMIIATVIPAISCVILAFFSIGGEKIPSIIALNIKFLSVSVVALAVGAQAASVAGVHAYLQDYACQKAGTILGITNTIGVFSCLLANKAIAQWVSFDAKTGFAKVFVSLALMYLSCGFIWVKTMKGERLDGCA